MLHKNAVTRMLKGELESRAKSDYIPYRYALINNIELLVHAAARPSRQRLLWVIPSIDGFKIHSEEDAQSVVSSSPKQGQLYRSLSPVIALARHSDDYRLLTWYLAIRDTLSNLVNQPFPVVPISLSHPRKLKTIHVANHAASLPSGCSIMDNLDHYKLHPVLRYLCLDLFQTLKQLSSEPMTHTRLHQAIKHTQTRAGKTILKIIQAQSSRLTHRNRSADVLSSWKTERIT
ncbi:hypothetical protein [Alteromonas sp. 14N.309.X.WAT.G.H12]|uniref:hypothetical protein n=1 Tax=Alteromonas sp. 14N.309.X.WAT.G.H12 TaxID=3120824 RepID=UPI002FD72070